MLRIIQGNNNGIISLAFSPDQQYIAAGSGDRVYSGVVRFSRLSDGALVRYFNQDPNNPGSYVTDVAYSPDGSLFAYAREDGVVVVVHNPLSSSACAGTLSTTSQMFPAAGGAGRINLAAPDGCRWVTACSDSWIVLTSAASGSGSSAINYEVRENFDGAARSAQISVAGQSFTVMQEGRGEGDCGYTLSPWFSAIAASGGTGTISVTAGAGCAWEAVSRADWLTLTSSHSGVGAGVVSYAAAANTSGLARKGKIVVGGQTFAVKQKAN